MFSLSGRNFFLSSLDVLKTNPVTEGLICILSVVGNCQTWFPFMIRGFTNQEIRRAINKKEPDTSKERGRMTRTLAKLRAHGLIRKIPHSRRYVISDKGRRVLGGLIETKRKVYPEFTAI